MAFMDRLGLPLYPAPLSVVKILESEKVRDRVKILAAGKLINAGRQLTAFAFGADAFYTARGFMLALGCIQAREYGRNTCPVGLTTHDVENTQRDLKAMLVRLASVVPVSSAFPIFTFPVAQSLAIRRQGTTAARIAPDRERKRHSNSPVAS